MKDYSELKKLAETADKKMPTFGAGIAHRQAFRDATSPAAVLALIAEVEYLRLEMSGVETAKQDLAEILGCADEPRWKWLHCNASSLKAEVEALRKDAERYRWLMSDAIYNGTLGVRDGWIDFEFKDEAQEQIDYCMKEDAE